MTCTELRTHAPALVDGELGVAETLAARAHLAGCPACRAVVEGETRLRELLRRQPRETAPPELRARIRARCRREAVVRGLVPWAGGAAVGLVAGLLLAPGLPVLRPGPPPLLQTLVATHVAYEDLEQPAEFASQEPRSVETWLLERAGLRTVVPDFSRAGLRLVGARLTAVDGRKAAFLLYAKGHSLLSVFVVPGAGRPTLEGAPVVYRGHVYLLGRRHGHRTVAWSEGSTLFALVSMLDDQALLECADVLRTERLARSQL